MLLGLISCTSNITTWKQKELVTTWQRSAISALPLVLQNQ